MEGPKPSLVQDSVEDRSIAVDNDFECLIGEDFDDWDNIEDMVAVTDEITGQSSASCAIAEKSTTTTRQPSTPGYVLSYIIGMLVYEISKDV